MLKFSENGSDFKAVRLEELSTSNDRKLPQILDRFDG